MLLSNNSFLKILGIVIILLSATVAFADGGESGGEGGGQVDDTLAARIPWVRLPEACKSAVKAYSDNLEILYIEDGTKFGIPIYEVKAMVDGKLTSLEMSADGRFIKVYEIAPPASLPMPVLQKLKDAQDNSKVGVRVRMMVSYSYWIEYEDGRPPIRVDSTGTPILENMEN